MLHRTEARVQPLYLVDDARGSTPREIQTMRTIRGIVENEVPGGAGRLLPTDFGSYRATTMEPHYRDAWEALKEKGRVGLQYPILASYAEQQGIDGLELGIQDGGWLTTLLRPVVELRDGPGGPVPAMAANGNGPERLFERFAFPLMDMTKLDMKAEAEESGWMPVMDLTWFCFRPVLGRPCGACYPCKIALSEGMRHRVGVVGPALRRVASLKSRARKGVDGFRRWVGRGG